MLANDFKRESEKNIEKLRNNSGTYFDFLRTMGNNHKYRYDAQISIFMNYPDAIACTSYNSWKETYQRQVKGGAKSIPILAFFEGRDRVVRIFDVSQTYSMDNTVKGPIRWEFDYERDKAIIERTIADYPPSENPLRTVAEKYYNESKDNILSELSDTLDFDVIDDFFISSIFVALYNRLDYIPSNNNHEQIAIAKGLKLLDSVDFKSAISYINRSNRNLIDFFQEESKKIIKQNELANISNIDNEGGMKNVLRRVEIHRGWKYYAGERSGSRRVRINRKNSATLRKENGEQIEKVRGLERNNTRSEVSNTESSLSGNERERSNTSEVPNGLREGQTISRVIETTEENRSISDKNVTTNEEGVGHQRRNEELRSTKMDRTDEQSKHDIRGNDFKRDDIHLEIYKEDSNYKLPFFYQDDYKRKMFRESDYLKNHRNEIKQNISSLNEKELAAYLKTIFDKGIITFNISENEIAGYKAYENGLHLWRGDYENRVSETFYDWILIARYHKTMDLLGELEENYVESNEPTLLFTEDFITAVLKRGSGVSEGKYRIYEQFAKSLSKKENIEFLKDEYGWGGASPVLTGSGIGEEHDGKGIRLLKNYSENRIELLLAWKDVESRLSKLILENKYLTSKEAELYPEWLENKVLEREKHAKDRIERERKERLRKEVKNNLTYHYEYNVGNIVDIEDTAYEIVDIKDTEVILADVTFPLIRTEFELSDFENSIKLSAKNDFLRVPDEDPETKYAEAELKAEEEASKDLIAAAINNDFIIIPRMHLVLANLSDTNQYVEVEGTNYKIYNGMTESDNDRIKFFFQMGEYELLNLDDYIKTDEINIPQDEETYESDDVHELATLKADLDTFIEGGMQDYSLILEGNTTTHIFRILDLYDKLEDKPTWINLEEINEIIEKIEQSSKVIDVLPIGKLLFYSENGPDAEAVEYANVELFKSDIKLCQDNKTKVDITIYENTDFTEELKEYIATLENTPRELNVEHTSYEDSVTELKLLLADCNEYLTVGGRNNSFLTRRTPVEQIMRIVELNNELNLISNEELLFYNREMLLSDSALKNGHIYTAVGRLDYYKDSNYVVSKEFDAPRMMATEVGIGRQGGYTVSAVLYTDKDGNHIPTDVFNNIKDKVNIHLIRNPYHNEIDIFLNDYLENEASEEVIPNIIKTNFKITDDILPINLKPGERLENNINAIKILKAAENGSDIGIEEQKQLAKYVGWGGLADVFDDSKKGQWDEARTYLKSALTAKEYAAARESTLTAFYTPKTVIDGIYEGLKTIGFVGGNILEPSMGIGNFIGNVSEELRTSKFYGVELDEISGNIAKYLYPESNVQVKGFEETTFSNNFFDIAIGNVPFADFKVSDKVYDKNNFLIHDYFFAKAIDKVRVGGVIAFITSSGTMDKKNAAIRHYIGARCDLLGAIRLPNDTFSGVAGTDVTSDIIFLKKKSVVLDNENNWYNLGTDEKGYVYNQYFIEHPEMVLGTITEISGPFGNKLACVPDGRDLKESLFEAVHNLDGEYEKAEVLEDYKEVESIPATDDVKNYSYTIVDGKIYYRENSLMYEELLKDKDVKRLKAYIGLSNQLREVIKLQMETDDASLIEEAQKKLDILYDDFADKYGRINARTNNLILRKDANYPLVSTLEIYDKDKYIGKSDIFTKRTIKKAEAVTSVENASDALLLSIAERGSVDFDYMESLTGIERTSLIDELSGQIFLDIKRIDSGYNDLPFTASRSGEDFAFRYITSDEYLSGNIRKKIEILDDYEFHINHVIEHNEDIAEDMAYNLEMIKYQKEKLNEVLPKELDASEINVRIGATWIPTDDIEAFMFELLETPRYAQWSIDVNYCEYTGEWNIKNKNSDNSNTLAYMQYGTSRKNAYQIIENALNLRDTKVYDQIIDDDGNKKSVLNKKETVLANQKEDIIKEEFKNWIFKEPERRNRLVKKYNELFNSNVNRSYDGSNLQFVGINPEIKLREHQKNAIARTLYGGNTLLAHVVGAGKTFEMVASAMEAKRLGMCNKSLFVVPNHLTEQFGREFMQLYPGADIMVATKKDFQPANRKRFISKIATSSYDAIIIGHSQFERIPMSKEFQVRNIEKQKDDILKYIEQYKNSRNQRFTVKQLEKTKKQLDKQLEDLNAQDKKDDMITFEELGVDRLYVDEAHYYKNLFIYTKMSNVAGISTTNAQKSFDMFLKCQYMDELTGGKGIVFATGTPVSNSMVELYTTQRYLQYASLEEHNLTNFDAWAATFGETIAANEIAPEGNSYRIKTRFAKFYNIPELMTIFKDCADIRTADQLALPVPEVEVVNIQTKPTRIQKALIKSIARRTKLIRDKQVDQNIDNMLLITHDGKNLALDQRLAFKDMEIPDDPKSKVNTCISQVYDIWQETSEDRLTQMIFCDMSTPKEGNSKVFTLYDDIKNKLISKGVPEEEIAFIHDAKTDKAKDLLFAKVRSGAVRILLGSTDKMGTGTNVQDKLIALHDLDVPWRPSDLQQRKGRIVRQGNQNKKVKIFRYITENTFDAYLWQTIDNKLKFINQIMTSKSPVRIAEDVDEVDIDVSNSLALATGNPLMKESITLTTEVSNLRLLESNYKANMYQLEDKILKTYPAEISRLSTDVANLEKDLNIAEPLGEGENKFTAMKVGNKVYNNKKDAGYELLAAAKHVRVGERKRVGSYRNFDIEIFFDTTLRIHKFILVGSGKYYGELGDSPDGNIQRMDNVITKMSDLKLLKEQQLETTEKRLADAKVEIEKPFDKAEELRNKVERLSIVNHEIEIMEGNEDMSKLICLDLETTGFDKQNDEILQFSIVDGNGITLLNEYVKPVRHSEWPQAMTVNNITPEMVNNASTLVELMPRLKEIFENAEIIVGYNSDYFDIPFIEAQTDIDLSNHRKADVMKMFDEYYGERNEYGEIKWQKLVKCAEFFNYGEFKAHDSLYDTKATLYAYNVMKALPDTSVTINEMYNYGYTKEMFPISVESAEDIILNEPNTSVYALSKDNTEIIVSNLMDAEKYADDGYLFGIDKEKFISKFKGTTMAIESDIDIEL